MKYIDADKLIHDLEERIYAYSEGYAAGDDYHKDAIETVLKDVRYQCSLQQEQQDFPTTDEEVEKFLATHPKVEVPDKYKTPDWLFKKQEQQEVDLEEEIEEYRMVNEWSESIPLNLFKVIARYFYGLGQLNSK